MKEDVGVGLEAPVDSAITLGPLLDVVRYENWEEFRVD